MLTSLHTRFTAETILADGEFYKWEKIIIIIIIIIIIMCVISCLQYLRLRSVESAVIN